jgi:hypothetical protein
MGQVQSFNCGIDLQYCCGQREKTPFVPHSRATNDTPAGKQQSLGENEAFPGDCEGQKYFAAPPVDLRH